MIPILNKILSRLGAGTQVCFRVTYPDGSGFQNRDGKPVVHVQFKTTAAAWNVVLFRHIGMLESFFDQAIDIEGDFGQLFAIGFESGFERSPGPLVWLRNQWHELRFGNRTIEQARANARFHYALGVLL